MPAVIFIHSIVVFVATLLFNVQDNVLIYDYTGGDIKNINIK